MDDNIGVNLEKNIQKIVLNIINSTTPLKFPW